LIARHNPLAHRGIGRKGENRSSGVHDSDDLDAAGAVVASINCCPGQVMV
jgi:hypothetical protein